MVFAKTVFAISNQGTFHQNIHFQCILLRTRHLHSLENINKPQSIFHVKPHGMEYQFSDLKEKHTIKSIVYLSMQFLFRFQYSSPLLLRNI